MEKRGSERPLPEHLFSLFMFKAISTSKSGLGQMQTVLKLRFHARPDGKTLFILDARGKLQQGND